LTTAGTVLIGVALSMPVSSANAQSDNQSAQSLESSASLERLLTPREEHRYRLALRPGEAARVIVAQRGIDVTVQVRVAERDVVSLDDDGRLGGEERLDVVADAAATYIVVITAAPSAVRAGSYAIGMASRGTATDADRVMQELLTLRTNAARLYEEEQNDEARALLERALILAERTPGADEQQAARVAAELAAVYLNLVDTARAEALYQRALAIMDRTFGTSHPTTAFTRSRLARVYLLSGQRLQAEALIEPALETIEKTLGPEHLWFVRCLGTLSALRHDAGDLEQAEQIVRRQVTILERIGHTDSMLYAGMLNNLGEIYARARDYARAEPLLNRSVVVYERVSGSDTYSLSYPLTNLGIIARDRKDFATAEAYYRRALAIRQRRVGSEHPDLLIILNNLANILSVTGDYARSLDTHFYALRLGERGLGPYHQNTLLSVGNIARVYAAAGDLTHALAYQRRADAILERQLALNLAVGSERQKLAFVAAMSERTDRTISLHLRDAPRDPDAASLGALVVLQRKGRVTDALIDTSAAVRQRIASPSDRQLLDRLKATTAELARFALAAPATTDIGTRRTSIQDLEARKERLEAELAEHSAEFRAQIQPVTLEAVRTAIPDDAALVEFAIFRPFNPRAERNAEAYAPPHYAAYVMRRHAPPYGVDLGPTDVIDTAIDAWRDALRDPVRSDERSLGRIVDRLTMRPVRASLNGATRLLIAPEGQLNLVPFDALVDEGGQYLIERYAISYLTSGRDLLRTPAIRATPAPPAIFANPVFGEPGAATVPYFSPLPATADEARAIKTLFPGAALLTGARATKHALQHLEAPQILHIASHGFFLQGREIDARNPLVRSGVALAGANIVRGAHRDGILTALEASGLNLWGTQLVTLSACDTGIGEVRNGEGVYGLRRAFFLAGAETVVMSLWPVGDASARQTMVAYYTRLRAGRGRADALRQAKLQILKQSGRYHPYHWAGFIQSGEWANLSGTR
jgi:CHAT domain-containing protein/Tfp pilus assembly protein PilF